MRCLLLRLSPLTVGYWGEVPTLVLRLTLARSGTVIVDWVAALSRYSAVDRAVVAAGGVCLVAGLVRVAAAGSRRYRLV